MKSIATELVELHQMSRPELVQKYTELYGKTPRTIHRLRLWRRCAWKLHEQRFGGLWGAARRRLDELRAELDIPLDDEETTVSGRLRRRSDPPIGTTLVRAYKGQEVRVDVTENGFEWNGVVYRSLSATAGAITGSHWNGRLFFGLTARKRSK